MRERIPCHGESLFLLSSSTQLISRNAPEIKSILGFESDTLVKGLDNPKRYYMSSSCNQVVVTNGTDSHVLILPSGYYTFTEFIEAVGAEMVKKVLPLHIHDDRG